ncbi:MAG: class I SAM-dependent methyltransferase [bacterium]|nr:class I SAM-dependent methyltransferase [bacterium]
MSGHGAAVHTPRYLVRRRAVREALSRLPPGRFLEVGCGRGEMLAMFRSDGFTGYALEISDSVIGQARAAAVPLHPDIQVVQSLDELPAEEFEYLFSFEVLEHIENDREELAKWLTRMSTQGRVVISVPARMKLWSAADEAVGHFRRYERGDVLALLEDVGLEATALTTFGYPLVLLTRPLRHLHHRLRRGTNQSDLEKTLDSSRDSTLVVPRAVRSLLRRFIELVAGAFYYLGLPLRHTNFGDGFVVVAKMRSQ